MNAWKRTVSRIPRKAAALGVTLGVVAAGATCVVELQSDAEVPAPPPDLTKDAGVWGTPATGATTGTPLIPDTSGPPAAGMVHSTSITRDDDGKLSAAITWMTKEQMAAEEAARKQSAGQPPADDLVALLDTGCAGASMWIYDGFDNRLCLSPSYVDDLTTFCNTWSGSAPPFTVCLKRWSEAATRFYSGSEPGAFQYFNTATCAPQFFITFLQANLTCPGQTWSVSQGPSQGSAGTACLPAQMNAPAGVVASAFDEQLSMREAYADCCIVCREHHTEALRPSPSGPFRGGFLRREKYCGTVRAYGTNNESGDPYDIMMNVEPTPGFNHFVAGLRNTECTPVTESFDSCEASGTCASSANDPRRCIHVEINPDDSLYGKDKRFLPILADSDGWGTTSELEPNGRLCAYGPYVIDHGIGHGAAGHPGNLCCSKELDHDRPEIHPADALWWRHPDADGWMFALMQDDSNRYSSPHCDESNNGNEWAQAPRDITLKFPFTYPLSSPNLRACLRHMRTKNFSNTNVVIPSKGVSTANTAMVARSTHFNDAKTFYVGTRPFITITEQVDAETEVAISGCVSGDYASGTIKVRATIGCNPKIMNCSGISGDPNDSYLFDELFFIPATQSCP